MINLSEIVANAFIELDEHQLPQIVDLHQVYAIAEIMSKNGNYSFDLKGTSVLELKLNGEQYFNYINDTKEFVPATGIKVEYLKERFRRQEQNETPNIYKRPEVLRVLGIQTRYEQPKIMINGRRFIK